MGDTRTVANALYILASIRWHERFDAGGSTLPSDALAPDGPAGPTPPGGDAAWAIATLEESLALFRQVGDPWGVALALTGGEGLGDWAWAQRDYARATAVYQEGLELHRQLRDMRNVARCLDRLARLALGQDRPQRAARLLGAAAAVYGASGTSRLPSQQPHYEQDRATVRARLGEEAFSAAWAEGRAMSLEEAIAYALDDSRPA